ncbi:MAG TPA: CcoQ/FixQ family Cbb3-type cytochrome c oxidase assembly chaperone [Casimicrobium huifangae]|jgi:cbb3-type cytochrome oxidase subunit 3|nr:CcoQ/FixQ family Cbb3-type cytochrome c oxidase assembly chaperone [Casimicrobium huifangae]
MDELRSAFTVISFATFIGIVWWAWRPGSKEQANRVVSDVMNDDDRNVVGSMTQGASK